MATEAARGRGRSCLCRLGPSSRATQTGILLGGIQQRESHVVPGLDRASPWLAILAEGQARERTLCRLRMHRWPLPPRCFISSFLLASCSLLAVVPQSRLLGLLGHTSHSYPAIRVNSKIGAPQVDRFCLPGLTIINTHSVASQRKTLFGSSNKLSEATKKSCFQVALDLTAKYAPAVLLGDTNIKTRENF